MTVTRRLGQDVFRDDRLGFKDDVDQTKQGVFQLSGITTGTTRVLTWPDFDGTFVPSGSGAGPMLYWDGSKWVITTGLTWDEAADELTVGTTLLVGTFKFTSNYLAPTTSDGSDDATAYLCGGGSPSVFRGGFVQCYGNESVPASAGNVRIVAGTVGGTPGDGEIHLRTGGTNRLVIDNPGDFDFKSGDMTTLGNISGVNITASGVINIPTTSSATVGVVNQNSTRFIHSFGTNNLFFGSSAGNFTMDSTNAADNVGVGAGALGALVGTAGGQGTANLAFGGNAMTSCTNGSSNIGIGKNALFALNTGTWNVAVGENCMRLQTSARLNTGVGWKALENVTGEFNTAIGGGALRMGTSEEYSVGIGYNAGRYNVTGDYNTSIGTLAGQGVTANSNSNNVFLGYAAGLTVTTGSNNIFVGYQAGDNVTSGASNIILGYDIDLSAAGVSNELNIGNIIYGDITSHIQIGDGLTDTNYTQIDNTGNMTFVGTATVWNDMQFQISDAKVTPAAALPSWEAFTANTSEYAFGIDKEVDTSANEIPHSWKVGTAGNAHMHITTKAVPAQEEKARFTVTFAYADTGEVWAEAPLTAELTIPISTTALTNFYLDLGDITLTNNLIEAQMRCRVKRIAKSVGGTEYVGDIFITQVGIHFEEDTIGSGTERAK